MILTATLFASGGAFNVILWFLTGRRFGFSPEKESPPSELRSPEMTIPPDDSAIIMNNGIPGDQVYPYSANTGAAFPSTLSPNQLQSPTTYPYSPDPYPWAPCPNGEPDSEWTLVTLCGLFVSEFWRCLVLYIIFIGSGGKRQSPNHTTLELICLVLGSLPQNHILSGLLLLGKSRWPLPQSS